MRLKAKGYKWAALELDDAEFGHLNRQLFDEYVRIFHEQGMKAGSWYTEGGSIYLTPSSSDFSIAEVEGPGDLEGVTNVINGVGGGPLPQCPLAIVTNFSTMTRENARPLIDAGFTCMPEAYLNESTTLTPDRLNYTARNLGWSTSQPVAGVYPVGGHPVPDYSQWADWPLADYLGEYVI